MKTLEYTKATGIINDFYLENEIEQLDYVPINKPSMRIFRRKDLKKILNGLLDIEKNHNHSWYKEMLIRSKKYEDKTALFYRGKYITYSEMMNNADRIAESLIANGVKKGDIVPACLSNTPESIYFLLALNKIGAVVNIFGNHLDKEYLNEILDNCSNKLLIASDDMYGELEDVISKRNYNKICLTSLADSLPLNPTKCKEYEPDLDKYYRYKSLVPSFKERDPRIVDYKEFYNDHKKCEEEVLDTGKLNDEFLITYTSGSTKVGHPSELRHKNRSLIVSGRFHDAELSGNPDLKDLRGMAHIHMESNTDIITSFSDIIMQGWAVAMEPEYGKETALDVLFINKPNFVSMTTSHSIQAFKDYLIKRRFLEEGRKMPWLFALFCVGEGTSRGEEKFINKGLRISRAGSGVKIGKLSLPFTTCSIGGGDCEHGGIYYTLWKKLMDKINYMKLKGDQIGLQPEPFVQVGCFKKNDDGTYSECDYNEYGIIAANSACTMTGYNRNPEKTLSLIFRDVYGRDWVSSNVYGYIDKAGSVHVKGRVDNTIVLDNNSEIPSFLLEDIICMDSKNILSCSVVKNALNEDNDVFGKIVINIEFQPDKKDSANKIIKSLIERINNKIGFDITPYANFRLINDKNQFPLSLAGKRNIAELEKMGLINTFKYSNLYDTFIPNYYKIEDSEVKSLSLKKHA